MWADRNQQAFDKTQVKTVVVPVDVEDNFPRAIGHLFYQ